MEEAVSLLGIEGDDKLERFINYWLLFMGFHLNGQEYEIGVWNQAHISQAAVQNHIIANT